MPKARLPERVVDGLSLYIRAISSKNHGTPRQLAKRMKTCGMSWVAIGAIWQLEGGRTTILNTPETIQRYADALLESGIRVFVWGYPWQGREAQFASVMRESAPTGACLLDPELGANPARSRSATAMKKANEHAVKLVQLMHEAGFAICGLSTFGTVASIKWFPLEAYLDALLAYFPNACFAGGQTYTDDARIDPSIADFLTAIDRAGHRNTIGAPDGIQLVPNFGLYSWEKRADGTRRARAKLPAELQRHLLEFVDEDEPVHSMIGWAENFLTTAQEPVLAQFSRLLARGAGALQALPPNACND